MTIRAVLGMLGADVHNKGLRTFGRRLRDLGAEVIYVGDHNTAEQLAAAAVAEDANVIGVSFGMASYVPHCAKLAAALRDIGADDIPIMVGGLVHREDTQALHDVGVQGVFTPGHSMDEVVAWLEEVTGMGVGPAGGTGEVVRGLGELRDGEHLVGDPDGAGVHGERRRRTGTAARPRCQYTVVPASTLQIDPVT